MVDCSGITLRRRAKILFASCSDVSFFQSFIQLSNCISQFFPAWTLVGWNIPSIIFPIHMVSHFHESKNFFECGYLGLTHLFLCAFGTPWPGLRALCRAHTSGLQFSMVSKRGKTKLWSRQPVCHSSRYWCEHATKRVKKTCFEIKASCVLCARIRLWLCLSWSSTWGRHSQCPEKTWGVLLGLLLGVALLALL